MGNAPAILLTAGPLKTQPALSWVCQRSNVTEVSGCVAQVPFVAVSRACSVAHDFSKHDIAANSDGSDDQTGSW